MLVGFVGRLSAEKGADVFLRMALRLRERRPDAHFVLVGEGAMLVTLQAFVARFQRDEVVHFAGMQQHMVEVLNEFDLAVSSSHSEAMPFAVMEAMACGLPVVACKVGGVADLIQHEVSGYVANDNDHDGLATRVTDLIGEPTRLAEFGAAGRRRACARLSLERIGVLHEAAGSLRASGTAVAAAR